ncbi:MAG: hypothetical protein Q8Q94_01595 [bacterium]|nr:hypothetical protein [bacterium]MDZ4299696.1 hypothetical protein [Candidatus Sungbacteria bacterium]
MQRLSLRWLIAFLLVTALVLYYTGFISGLKAGVGVVMLIALGIAITQVPGTGSRWLLSLVFIVFIIGWIIIPILERVNQETYNAWQIVRMVNDIVWGKKLQHPNDNLIIAMNERCRNEQTTLITAIKEETTKWSKDWGVPSHKLTGLMQKLKDHEEGCRTEILKMSAERTPEKPEKKKSNPWPSWIYYPGAGIALGVILSVVGMMMTDSAKGLEISFFANWIIVISLVGAGLYYILVPDTKGMSIALRIINAPLDYYGDRSRQSYWRFAYAFIGAGALVMVSGLWPKKLSLKRVFGGLVITALFVLAAHQIDHIAFTDNATVRSVYDAAQKKGGFRK